MDGNRIYQKITELARKLGFTASGVAPAAPLGEEFSHYITAMEEGCFAGMEYLKRNCNLRRDPRQLFEGGKSLLLFLAPYGEKLSAPEREISFADGSHGFYKVASYALGRDYHKVIKKRLSAILDYIKRELPGAEGRVFTDSAPILERAWGVRAGLGFIGKNNFLINREVGIRNFIGVIISNVEFAPVFDMALYKNYCGECRRCIESCPSGALSPFRVDASRCISYLTIEKREACIELNRELAEEREGWIFGCDACMNACPWNGFNRQGWSEFNPQPGPIPAAHLHRR